MKTINIEKFNQIIENITNKKYIHGATFRVLVGESGEEWTGASGNLQVDSAYYIASINKMFVSALILKLINEEKLSFDNPLSNFIQPDVLKGLHVYKGKDYSKEITVLHLLSQTSGLPCFLSDKPKKGKAPIKELEEGIDQPWPINKVMDRVRALEAYFPPGMDHKAKYVDTNHQLLNLVFEGVTKKTVKDGLDQLFKELQMSHTYVCEDIADKSYIFPYYKNEKRNISQFITSTNNDIISTTQDQILFIKAFFNGYFYPKDHLKSLELWKPIFFPFQYGIGIQKFYMPRMMSPLRKVPDMIGHCGSTGAVAYYVPDLDVYITGTTNQQASPNAAFQTMIKMVHSLLEK